MSQGQFLDTNGARVHYEIEGHGPPLVLIHGWSLNLRMFDPQVPAFSREYHVIRMDRRGFGRSSDGEDTTWDAADLKAHLDHLGVARAHVLGMSQGGAVALAFAVAFPDRVERLILHGPPAPSGFGLPWAGPDRWPLADYRALAEEKGLDAFRLAWRQHPLLAIPAENADARRRLDEMLAAYRGGLILKPLDPSGPTKVPALGDLAKILAPTLVLTGDEEIPYFTIVADALAYTIPKARRVVVPGGGHLINLVQPERYNEVVLDFLRTASGSQR
jgi:pimeloyl-ACP methyl ester carboxylesterase